MNEISTVDVRDLDPEQLGGEIRLLTMQARRVGLYYAVQIGYRLRIAHEKVGPHGWAEWLKKETDFSAASASRLESLYEGYGEDQGSLLGVGIKFPTLKNISISNALRLLALPEEERESFAETNDVEHMSARDVEALVKERTAALEAEKTRLEEARGKDRDEMQKMQDAIDTLTEDRDELEDMRAKAEEQLKRIQQELREIEARPQPVAVERDEKAIEEAVQAERERAEAEKKEAEKDFRKKLKELKEQISSTASAKTELEKQLAELRAKADAAEQDGLEAEQLREKIKAMEAKLALATPEVAEFKAAFDRAQAELVTMLKALRKVQDEEVKTKLTQAAETMLGNFSRQIGG
jgi:DNA repair exonuclease SbcCD ATPase subunit